MKHHSEDYKQTAVLHYLDKTNNYTHTCEEFNCDRISLMRWVKQYEEIGSIKRQHRKPISYKITQEQVKYATQLLRKDQQISMHELVTQMKQKYKDFDITPQWLGKVLRDNNKTRKRTRHKHFPNTRRKKHTNQKKELLTFYKKINTYPISKIISIDESSIKPFMMKEYSRCDIDKRCIAKTDENIVFRSYTLLVAINNNNCIGWFYTKKVEQPKNVL
jgi:transposase-like protein